MIAVLAGASAAASAVASAAASAGSSVDPSRLDPASVGDDVTAALVLLGGLLSLAAGIGIVRFPDVLSRLHAATKPQILGLTVILIAIVVRNPTWATVSTVVLILFFQVLTQPMTAHMIGRASYRSSDLAEDTLLVDELAPVVEEVERAAAEKQRSEDAKREADAETEGGASNRNQ